jgi:hypothetical protein
MQDAGTFNLACLHLRVMAAGWRMPIVAAVV